MATDSSLCVLQEKLVFVIKHIEDYGQMKKIMFIFLRDKIVANIYIKDICVVAA